MTAEDSAAVAEAQATMDALDAAGGAPKRLLTKEETLAAIARRKAEKLAKEKEDERLREIAVSAREANPAPHFVLVDVFASSFLWAAPPPTPPHLPFPPTPPLLLAPQRRSGGQKTQEMVESIAAIQRKREIDKIKADKEAEEKERKRIKIELLKDKVARAVKAGKPPPPEILVCM